LTYSREGERWAGPGPLPGPALPIGKVKTQEQFPAGRPGQEGAWGPVENRGATWSPGWRARSPRVQGDTERLAELGGQQAAQQGP
jgi:hypothetical protein